MKIPPLPRPKTAAFTTAETESAKEVRPARTGARRPPGTARSEQEEAAFRREVAKRELSWRLYREERNFWLALVGGVIVFVGLVFVALSGRFDPQDSASAKSVIFPLLTNVAAFLIGRKTNESRPPDRPSSGE